MSRPILTTLLLASLFFLAVRKKATKNIKRFMSRGYSNKNPGNIRKTKTLWLGEIQGTDKDFKTFKSMAYGYRAIFVVLNTYMKKGINTIEQMINTYAPPIENNTKSYINFVVLKSGKSKDSLISPIDFKTLKLIVGAISHIENGIIPDNDEIEAGFSLWKS